MVAFAPDTPGVGHLQGRRIGVKALFGLQLQQAVGVGVGQGRDLGLGDQQARDRQGHRAGTLADSGLVESGAEFLADRFGIARIEFHRQFGLELGHLLESGRGSPQEGALDAPTLPGKPEHGLGGFAGTGSRFQEMDHAVFWAFSY